MLLRNPTATRRVEVGERIREAVARWTSAPFGVAGRRVGRWPSPTTDEPIAGHRARRQAITAKRTRERVIGRSVCPCFTAIPR